MATAHVTVVVPCRNEARYIGACLDSILASAYPADAVEVLVVDGRSTDGTRALVADYSAKHPQIRWLDNPKRVVPTALNIGVQAATGDVIVRMDAHVVYPPEYIPRLVAALTQSGADNVGGCIVTLPADGTAVAQAIAVGLGHPFGVGNSRFRIGARKARFVDTVPFGCFPRDVFRRVGLFDEEMVRNQDDEFNNRILRTGGKVLLVPDVVCYYYTRGSFRQIARMFFQYGAFKPLAARKAGRIMTVRQLIPAAFVTGLLGSAAAALVWPPAIWITAAIAGLYAAAVLVFAVRVAASHGRRCAVALTAVFPVVHFSYGFGFLRGLWAGLSGRGGRWRDPAAVPLSREERAGPPPPAPAPPPPPPPAMATHHPEVAGLMYHEVSDDPTTSGFQRPGALPYTFSRAAFASHLDAIAAGPLVPELISDIDLGRPGRGRHLVLTFDDGGASALYAAEQLARRGWKAHFFIITARIGERTFLKQADIRTLRSAGHVIGTHSHTHPDIFRSLSRGLMASEWGVSRAILESLLGEPCVAASVPGGDISRAVLESAGAAGLQYLFTSEPLLAPERVGDTWILGRVILKSGVSAATIRELAAFRGWQRAKLLRRLGGLARTLSPSLYAQYVRLRTREGSS